MNKTPPSLHIIEPTLINGSGHCFALVNSLAKANAEKQLWKIHLWAGKQADLDFPAQLQVDTHTTFSRRIRRLQVYFLLRKLLNRGETIFLPTASRAELAAYALIPERIRKKGRAYFYVHQMRVDGSKGKRLKAIANRAPETRVLCTTDSLAASIRDSGFTDVREQAYPFEVPNLAPQNNPFRHIIFPGIARMDKNLPFMAELLSHMSRKKSSIPMMIQAAPNHHGEYAADVSQTLHDIEATLYPHLNMPKASLSDDEYLNQFVGGICLQPYVTSEYSNKISGITLDALTRGCPVIVQKGIHSAELVEQFKAGICLDSCDPDSWLEAMEKVVHDYATYKNNCRKAFEYLARTHHPMRTLETLTHWE